MLTGSDPTKNGGNFECSPFPALHEQLLTTSGKAGSLILAVEMQVIDTNGFYQDSCQLEGRE